MYSSNIPLEQVMHGHIMLLVAFFVESQSPARAVMIVIVDLEFQYRAHTGEAVEHCGNTFAKQGHEAFSNISLS
jgi:hypothetical protein